MEEKSLDLLSSKEQIVNILSRLFNNGHISGDELSLMQKELVVRSEQPEPAFDLAGFKTAFPEIFDMKHISSIREEYIPNPYAIDEAARLNAARLGRIDSSALSGTFHVSNHGGSIGSCISSIPAGVTYVNVNKLTT